MGRFTPQVPLEIHVKDLKRLVRGYTTARAQLREQKPAAAAPPTSAPSAAPDYAKLAGRSDAVLEEKTGCTWERWVRALDHVQAYTWSHRQIAKHVQEKYRVSGWWAQGVTVGYERIEGLRTVGQRRDGSFEATKSRTFAVPLVRLYRAFHDARTRARWLPGVELTVRTATRGKSMRITCPDRTSVAVEFTGKGPAKSQVAVQHGRLPDRAAAARVKQYRAERLDALKEVLTPG
jgi:hypothetical protein